MKVTLDRQEVEQIVLAHMQTKFPGTHLNTVRISTYTSEFCTVDHEEPEPEVTQLRAA